MVPELRKRHRLIWRLWAVLLPLGFVFAILVLPKRDLQSEAIIPMPAALPVVEQSRENDWLTARLRTLPDHSAKQLEIVLKQAVSDPSANLYWQDTYVGNLGGKGSYRFELDSVSVAAPPFRLKIESPINQIVLYQTTFEQ